MKYYLDIAMRNSYEVICNKLSLDNFRDATTSQFMMTICVIDESPYGLSYPSTLNTFTVNTSISPLIPIVQGGDGFVRGHLRKAPLIDVLEVNTLVLRE